MRFGIGSLLAALLVVVPLAAEDKKDDKSKDREQQFKELQSSYQKALEDAGQEYQALTAAARKKAASAVVKLVEADPKDDLAFRMLLWACQTTQYQEPPVLDLLAEYHFKSPEIVEMCRMMARNPSEKTAAFLRKVLKDCPEKSARGYACYALAHLANNEATNGDPRKEAEAEKLYERVLKEFADVKSIRGPTLGELAKVESKLLIGKTAPEITSEDLEGEKVQLKDYRGKVVVLDIWATWCGPCRAMIPHEREMVEKLKGKPFALVSISFDKEKDTLKKFLTKEPMPWMHWWDGGKGGIAKELSIKHFPTIYVLDAKGVIRYKELRGKKLEEVVEKLLAEMKDKT